MCNCDCCDSSSFSLMSLTETGHSLEVWPLAVFERVLFSLCIVRHTSERELWVVFIHISVLDRDSYVSCLRSGMCKLGRFPVICLLHPALSDGVNNWLKHGQLIHMYREEKRREENSSILSAQRIECRVGVQCLWDTSAFKNIKFQISSWWSLQPS